MRETCVSQPRRRFMQDAFWAVRPSGNNVGDLGEDVGVVGEVELFGCPHYLIGRVGWEGAGELGQLGVRDGPHVLIEREEFLAVSDLADGLWGSETRPLALTWAFMRLARIR